MPSQFSAVVVHPALKADIKAIALGKQLQVLRSAQSGASTHSTRLASLPAFRAGCIDRVQLRADASTARSADRAKHKISSNQIAAFASVAATTSPSMTLDWVPDDWEKLADVPTAKNGDHLDAKVSASTGCSVPPSRVPWSDRVDFLDNCPVPDDLEDVECPWACHAPISDSSISTDDVKCEGKTERIKSRRKNRKAKRTLYGILLLISKQSRILDALFARFDFHPGLDSVNRGSIHAVDQEQEKIISEVVPCGDLDNLSKNGSCEDLAANNCEQLFGFGDGDNLVLKNGSCEDLAASIVCENCEPPLVDEPEALPRRDLSDVDPDCSHDDDDIVKEVVLRCPVGLEVSVMKLDDTLVAAPSCVLVVHFRDGDSDNCEQHFVDSHGACVSCGDLDILVSKTGSCEDLAASIVDENCAQPLATGFSLQLQLTQNSLLQGLDAMQNRVDSRFDDAYGQACLLRQEIDEFRASAVTKPYLETEVAKLCAAALSAATAAPAAASGLSKAVTKKHAKNDKLLGLGFSKVAWQAMSRQTQIDSLQHYFGRKFSAGQDLEIGHHLKHAYEFSHSELVMYFGDELHGD